MNNVINDKRKIVLISRRFQVKLIVKFVLINALILVLFGGVFYIFLNSEIDAQLLSAHNRLKSVQQMLFPIIVTLSIFNLIVSGTIISFVVLIASFRIAGPIYRFNEALKCVESKNLAPHTRIRNKDQLGECAATLDRAVNTIREDMCGMNADIDTAIAIIGKKKTDPRLSKIIRSMKKRVSLYKC